MMKIILNLLHLDNCSDVETFVRFQLYAEKVATRGLCAIAQAESLRYKLIGGLAVRRLI